MKKSLSKIAVLFSLCLLMAAIAFKADLQAADITANTEKVAYLEGKNAVLRFVPFSTAGYTYNLEGNGMVVKGTLGKDARDLTAALPQFARDKTYSLTLTATDTGNSITVVYYTGNSKINGVTALQSDNNVNASWNLDGENDYSGFRLEVANQPSEGFEKYLSKDADSKDARNIVGTDSRLVTGNLAAYIVGIKDGMYGYGAKTDLSFLATPSSVAGITLTPGKSKVTVEWIASRSATGYIVSVKKPGASKFSQVKKTTKTKFTLTGVKSDKAYYFKVQAYSTRNGQTKNGPVSAAKSIKLNSVPSQVTGITFYTDPKATAVGIKWNASKGAKLYEVWVKIDGVTGGYQRYGSDIARTAGSLKAIMGRYPGKNLTFKIYGKKGSVRSKASRAVSINPQKYLEKNAKKLLKERQRILAMKIRTIRYLSRSKAITTTKVYPNETKEAYVNYFGFSSKTKYLIWANLYTQQATIFTGKKGNWKILRTFDIASGSPANRTKRGTHKITYKEYQWKHPNSKTQYVSHFYKKQSFHARPKTLGGRIFEKTLRKPISNACIRMEDQHAIFIYKHVPVGTTVRVW